MALKKYKPTSPGRRFMSVSSFEEITKTEPEQLADRADQEDRRPQRQRAHHHPPPGRRAQAPLPDHRLQAPEGRRAGEGGRDRVRPEPVGPDRAAPLRRRREGVHPRAGAARGRRDRRVGPGADIRPGNALPLENIPTGTMVHNVELKPGRGGQLARSAGSGIQLVAKDDGYGVLRLPSGEMRRVPLSCRATVGQVGNVDHENQSGRQGRPEPLAREAPVRARLGDEPRRPPARRRRGQVEGRPSPGHALGRADARQAHALEAQGIRQADRPPEAAREREEVASEQIVQEGALRRGAPDEADRGDERLRQQADDPHLVAHLDDLPGDGRATRSPSTTAASTCPCSSPSRWSGTSSASSRPTRMFRGHAGDRQTQVKRG